MAIPEQISKYCKKNKCFTAKLLSYASVFYLRVQDTDFDKYLYLRSRERGEPVHTFFFCFANIISAGWGGSFLTGSHLGGCMVTV